MKYKWLNRKFTDNLIIFFNGWGMDENVVKHLNHENVDVVMFYDYNDLETDFKLPFEYKSIKLVAWSMGVMIASIVMPLLKINLEHSVAINGTLFPIDAEYGINPKIYDLTVNSFNENVRNQFVRNMFTNKDTREFELIRTLDNQKSELIALKKYKSNTDFKYDRVLISDNDKIIPTKNQVNYWKIGPNLKGGHCPFFSFKSWGEIL